MVYEFDSFVLDVERAELRQAGELVHVEPQVFDLIKLLASSNGKLLSRDDLYEALWGDRVVSEAALSSRIRDARRILGDTGKEQRMIRTVKKRGLQFVPTVTAADKTDVPFDHMALPDLSDKPSIGVLPFKTIGGSEEDSFIATGLTEDITANLARFRGLLVFSRTTTSTVANSLDPIVDLRRQHGVDLVLQGTLQRSGERLRVRIQMVEAASGAILLSEQFDRPFTPSSQFDIQDEIAGLVAARAGDLHGPTGQMVMRLERAGRPKRWDTVVWLARFHDYTILREPTLFAEVTAGLQQALEHDPHSSDGWAALSRMRVEEYRLPFHYPAKLSLLDEALEYARKAVRIDGSNDFALASLALAHFHRYETEEFRAAAQSALSVNPNNSFTLAEIAMCHCLQSNFDQAMPLARRAIELSPVHPGWFRMPIACGLFMQGDANAALEEQLKAPVAGYFWYHAHLAAYYADLGQKEKASSEVATTLELYPQFEERIYNEGFVLSVGAPFFDRMAEAWRKAGFKIADEPYISGYK